MSAKERRSPTRGEVAYHEAGHAVAAYIRGVPFRAVVINSRRRARRDGVAGYVALRDIAVSTHETTKSVLVLSLCGEIAEEKHRRLHTGQRVAKDHLAYIGGDASVILPYSNFLARGNDGLAKAIVDVAFDVALKIVNTHWLEICALARALAVHGTLTESRAIGVLRRALNPPPPRSRRYFIKRRRR